MFSILGQKRSQAGESIAYGSHIRCIVCFQIQFSEYITQYEVEFAPREAIVSKSIWNRGQTDSDLLYA